MWTNSKKPSTTSQRPAFVNTAEAFCAHIESAATFDRISFIPVCFVLISRLLSEVIELPEATGQLDTHNIADERYNEIIQLLKTNLQEGDYYTMMLDPYEVASQPVVGSVVGDLADIWRGLKDGLEALAAGSLENAIAQWRFSFANQWGDQATQVLRPLMTVLLRNGWQEQES